MIPIIIKPRLIELKNRFTPGLKTVAAQKNLLTLLLIILSFVLIFDSTCTVIAGLQVNPHTYTAKIKGILGSCFSMVFMMLLVTNTISAAHTLFFAKDLERIIAAPINSKTLFIGKFLENLFMNCWIISLFAVPACIGLCFITESNIINYPIILVSLILYLSIPTAVGITLTTLLASVISLRRCKELMLSFALITAAFIAWNVHSLRLKVDPLKHQGLHVLELHKYQSELNYLFPARWMTDFIFDLTNGSFNITAIFLIVSLLIATGLIAYLTISGLHNHAYNRGRHSIAITKRPALNMTKQTLHSLAPVLRALLIKEYKTFTRDVTQGLQMLLLLMLAIIYVYNFTILEAPNISQPAAKELWKSGIMLLNVMLGGMIILAICNRFVFSTVSLEGKSMWLIQAAPLKIEDYLNHKLKIWWFFVASVASIIFVAGALVNGASAQVVIVNSFLALVISYGLTGLAVGLGAYFAKFDWHYSYQITASFGSLIFMLSGMLLLMINLIPPSILLGYRLLEFSGISITQRMTEIISFSAILMAALVNYLTARLSIKLGSRYLDSKLA